MLLVTKRDTSKYSDPKIIMNPSRVVGITARIQVRIDTLFDARRDQGGSKILIGHLGLRVKLSRGLKLCKLRGEGK
jgi:hypothetical protein